MIVFKSRIAAAMVERGSISTCPGACMFYSVGEIVAQGTAVFRTRQHRWKKARRRSLHTMPFQTAFNLKKRQLQKGNDQSHFPIAVSILWPCIEARTIGPLAFFHLLIYFCKEKWKNIIRACTFNRSCSATSRRVVLQDCLCNHVPSKYL